jgi:aryl-alcohol dehydrogenase-like predicted oxidoreductase
MATPVGTANYFKRASVHSSKIKSFDGLLVSALGAGTYLGAADEETDAQYKQFLLQAGLDGINFFDTASHYRAGRSEKVLGRAIELLAARGVDRDRLVLATKGGYIPFDGSEEEFPHWLRTHYLDRGLFRESDLAGTNHCIHPSFLEEQIELSLENLKTGCIDLYYLQNPEVQLEAFGEEEFYKRCREAFSLLEKKIEEKKIGRFGIATWNGFRKKKGALQLSRLLSAAQEVAGESHHFKAIQLPLNLIMIEALQFKNQLIGKEKKTILQAALESGISVMASSPLMQSQVSLLPRRLFEKLPFSESPIAQAIQFVLSTPEICTAFIGTKAHWEENRGLLLQSSWEADQWKSACSTLGITE